MMADAIFDIAALMSDVTEEEAAEIFKPQSRRAPNFAAYQMLINAQEIGARKHVDIPKDHENPEQAARDLRYNLNEAAKERMVWKTATLTDDEKAQLEANRRIDRFEREDGTVVTKMKDGWKTEVKEPVVLRWKIDTREEKQNVEEEVEENGQKVKKTVEKTVKIPTRMHYVSVATTAIVHRARRNGPVTVTHEQTNGADTSANGTTEGAPQTEGAPAA
jgi:hypothetical protein